MHIVYLLKKISGNNAFDILPNEILQNILIVFVNLLLNVNFIYFSRIDISINNKNKENEIQKKK